MREATAEATGDAAAEAAAEPASEAAIEAAREPAAGPTAAADAVTTNSTKSGNIKTTNHTDTVTMHASMASQVSSMRHKRGARHIEHKVQAAVSLEEVP